MRRLAFAAVAAALAVIAGGCRSGGNACAVLCSGPRGGVTKHVVLVGVDGFGARYVPWNVMPNLSALRDGGVYGVGRNSFPTSSGINWATAMFGTVVEIHGYRNWNSRLPDVPAWRVLDTGRPACIFHEIRRQRPDACTAALYNWDGIGFCMNSNDVSFAEYFAKGSPEQRDDDAMSRGIELIAKRHPSLTFVYQHMPDINGHKFGWGTPEFTNACVNVDRNLGRLRDAIARDPEMADAVILLVADHGGTGKRHGSACLECFEIPFLVNGAPVKDMALREPVLLADTAPTIAWLLGLDVIEEWRGRPALKCRR